MTGRWDGVVRVLRKELREARRDRSLLISVVLVPLFLYPIVGFGAFQVLQIIRGISEQTDTVVWLGEGVPGAIREALAERERFDVREIPTEHAAWSIRPPDVETFRKVREEGPDPADAVLLWLPENAPRLYYDRSRDRSVSAREAVAEDLESWRRERIVAAYADVGLTEGDLDLWSVERENTASAEERGQGVLALALPMILLFMLATGTYYASIDTIVGERERGTIETILTSPLERGQVLVGKYLYVVLASLVALVLNLASMTLFLGFLMGIAGAEDVRIQLTPLSIGLIVLTGVLLAGFLSAVMMVVTTPAKTYREGQAMLTPVYVLTFLPGILVSVSREEFALRQAAIPLVNAVALFKSALVSEYPPLPILLTFAVLGLCTFLALKLAARIAAREDVYLDASVSLRELLTGKEGARP